MSQHEALCTEHQQYWPCTICKPPVDETTFVIEEAELKGRLTAYENMAVALEGEASTSKSGDVTTKSSQWPSEDKLLAHLQNEERLAARELIKNAGWIFSGDIFPTKEIADDAEALENNYNSACAKTDELEGKK